MPSQIYWNKATGNKLPQTYLYAAYERRYRFWKLMQMAQKLAIIVVTMFVPMRVVYKEFKVCFA